MSQKKLLSDLYNLNWYS